MGAHRRQRAERRPASIDEMRPATTDRAGPAMTDRSAGAADGSLGRRAGAPLRA
jgi:hypothetical protein